MAAVILGWLRRRLNGFGGLVAALFGAIGSGLNGGAAGHQRRSVVARVQHRAAGRGRGSAMAGAAGSRGLAPVDEAGSTRKVAGTGAAIELVMVHQVENDGSIVSGPYHAG